MSVRTSTRRIATNDDGNAAVEFAMIGPLLIVMVAAIFSIGWVMHSISSVRYALEEAGRTLLVNPAMTENELITLVTNKLGQLANGNVVVSLVVDQAQNGIMLAHANAAIPLNFDVPLLPQFGFTFDTSVTIPLIAP